MATAAPPAEHERDRVPRRRGRGSRRVAVGAALLALAFLLALRQLGLLFPDHIVWPVMLAAAGVALIWRQWGGRGRPAPPPTIARPAAAEAAPEPAVTDERAALRTLYRGGFGVALIVGAGLLFLYANGALSGLGDVALTALVAIVALGLILAPFWWRLGNTLAAERAERIRSQERAEVAAHLHDSVLQTLALVQQRADDPKTVATLARRQERELRDWLRARPPTAERESFSAALEAAAEEVEEAHGVRIDVVAVGDHPLDERAEALVAAAREALTNAAKFAGDAGPVSAYAEASPRRVQVFVRDRGPGFALDAVPPDRRGVRESIVGRMARHGGTATVHTGTRPGDRGRAHAGGRRVNPSVVIVDDHELFRAGVRSELAAHVEVVGDADGVESAVPAILATEPDVVLLDVHMPGGGGVEVIRQVAKVRPEQRFLALSVSDAPDDVIAVIRAGARGYVTKSITPAELADAVRRVADGDAVFSPRLAGFVLDAFAGALPASQVDPELDQLTAREREVLQHIARGYMYKEIALRLGISAKTVEAHVSAVLRKLQLSNRHELSRWAAERRLVD